MSAEREVGTAVMMNKPLTKEEREELRRRHSAGPLGPEAIEQLIRSESYWREVFARLPDPLVLEGACRWCESFLVLKQSHSVNCPWTLAREQ